MKKEIKRAVALSSLAYFEPETILMYLQEGGYENFEWINNKDTDTQVILCTHRDNLFIIFRGTEFTNLNDWLTNLDCGFHSHIGWGQVHGGFHKDVLSVYKDIVGYLVQYIDLKKIHIGGHSQGAGDATICAILLAGYPDFESLSQVGCPRVTGRAAAKKFGARHGSKIHRIVNNNDLVTRIPTRLMGYRHIENSNLYYFKETGECVNEISAWEAFKDRVYGRIMDIGEMGTDGIKDHSAAHYVQLVESLTTE
jgi:predicted lipase